MNRDHLLRIVPAAAVCGLLVGCVSVRATVRDVEPRWPLDPPQWYHTAGDATSERTAVVACAVATTRRTDMQLPADGAILDGPQVASLLKRLEQDPHAQVVQTPRIVLREGRPAMVAVRGDGRGTALWCLVRDVDEPAARVSVALDHVESPGRGRSPQRSWRAQRTTTLAPGQAVVLHAGATAADAGRTVVIARLEAVMRDNQTPGDDSSQQDRE